jgi:hypothetical protein
MAANDAIGIKYAPLPIERYSRVIHLVWRHTDPRVIEFKDLAALLGPLASARHPTVQPFGASHLARRAVRSLPRKRGSRASQRSSD